MRPRALLNKSRRSLSYVSYFFTCQEGQLCICLIIFLGAGVASTVRAVTTRCQLGPPASRSQIQTTRPRLFPRRSITWPAAFVAGHHEMLESRIRWLVCIKLSCYSQILAMHGYQGLLLYVMFKPPYTNVQF